MELRKMVMVISQPGMERWMWGQGRWGGWVWVCGYGCVCVCGCEFKRIHDRLVLEKNNLKNIKGAVYQARERASRLRRM